LGTRINEILDVSTSKIAYVWVRCSQIPAMINHSVPIQACFVTCWFATG
jgi:hypothetical protein